MKKISNHDFMEIRQVDRQSIRVKVVVLVIRGSLERARALMVRVVWCIKARRSTC